MVRTRPRRSLYSGGVLSKTLSSIFSSNISSLLSFQPERNGYSAGPSRTSGKAPLGHFYKTMMQPARQRPLPSNVETKGFRNGLLQNRCPKNPTRLAQQQVR